MIGGGAISGDNFGTSITLIDSDLISNGTGLGSSGGAIDIEEGILTIQGEWEISGNTSFSGGAIAAWFGADVNLSATSQSTFENNNALSGGAIYAKYSTTVDMMGHIAFLGNYGGADGGAIYARENSAITCAGTRFGNVANPNYTPAGGLGGAVYLNESSFEGENCLFDSNSAAHNGGAIAAYTSTVTLDTDYTSCDPTTDDCSLFSGNIADSDGSFSGAGGALYAEDSTLNIANTIFRDNSAQVGGAIYQTGDLADASIGNALIYNNNSVNPFGTGIHSNGGLITITNSTLAHNFAGSGYAQFDTAATINNSIGWGNANGGFMIESGTVTSECNIDESSNVGTNSDPLFIDPSSGDFHVDPYSPAVDVCATGLGTDLDGILRPVGPAYDMGVYETRTPDSTPPTSSANSSPYANSTPFTHQLVSQ